MRGLFASEASLTEGPEVVISVRGRNRFVVMVIEQFQYLRACQLEVVLAEARTDLAAGRWNPLRPPGQHPPPITKVSEVAVGQVPSFRSSRAITSRWIWLAPSKIWVSLASRNIRSTG